MRSLEKGILIRLTKEQKDFIDSQSERLGLDRSSYVRMIINEKKESVCKN